MKIDCFHIWWIWWPFCAFDKCNYSCIQRTVQYLENLVIILCIRQMQLHLYSKNGSISGEFGDHFMHSTNATTAVFKEQEIWIWRHRKYIFNLRNGKQIYLPNWRNVCACLGMFYTDYMNFIQAFIAVRIYNYLKSTTFCISQHISETHGHMFIVWILLCGMILALLTSNKTDTAKRKLIKCYHYY
jgi:hypothetical protein